MTTNRPKPARGNDLYREIPLPGADQPFQVTYWDLWIILTIDDRWRGNWEGLIDHLRAENRLHGGDQIEGLLNHVRLLRQALAQAGLSAAEVLAGADPALLKKQTRQARRKVLDRAFDYGEKSPWMIDTPRKLCRQRAMRGYWPEFPVSPEEDAALLHGQYKRSGYYNEKQSWILYRKLSRFLRKHEQDASLPQLFALYRAFLTVVLERMDMVDDSFGMIGLLYGEVFDTYVSLDPRPIGLPAAVFYQDLIELIIWEEHSFTWKHDRAFLAGLDPEEVPLVESILRVQWRELAALELEYRTEKALTLLGMLCTEQRLFDRFVPLAREMGTRSWERITTMSEMAERHGRYDLALAVYEAALGPGMHEALLRKRYAELKSRLLERGQ